MHAFIWESCPVAFKYFRVSLGACVINFNLKYAFYIDIDKNIFTYFNTWVMLFCYSYPNLLANTLRINGG